MCGDLSVRPTGLSPSSNRFRHYRIAFVAVSGNERTSAILLKFHFNKLSTCCLHPAAKSTSFTTPTSYQHTANLDVGDEDGDEESEDEDSYEGLEWENEGSYAPASNSLPAREPN